MIIDSEKKFETQATRIYAHFKLPTEIALDEAKKLWLAWRGDSDYLISCLSNKTDKESAWRVIHYTELPDLCNKYDHVEAQSLNKSFSDHVIAFLSRFLTDESGKLPGVETISQASMSLEYDQPEISVIDPHELFGHINNGREICVRWRSANVPNLFAKVFSLSCSSFKYSNYPKLDAPIKNTRTSNFMLFFKRDEASSRRRRRRSLTRWVMFG